MAKAVYWEISKRMLKDVSFVATGWARFYYFFTMHNICLPSNPGLGNVDSYNHVLLKVYF